jgi:hypothetical protein
MKIHPILLSALLLYGCASGGDLINVGENAWRVMTIDNTESEARRVAVNQATKVCGNMGKAPLYSPARINNDMPARYVATMEFQCAAGGTSPEALAEARNLGFRRDCAIAGFPLGSPENRTCAADVAAKASPRAVPAR